MVGERQGANLHQLAQRPVSTVVHWQVDGRQFAVKKVNVSRMKPKEIKEAMNEISVLSVLTKHPCIVTYRESFLEKGWLCILMDFAEGGV